MAFRRGAAFSRAVSPQGDPGGAHFSGQSAPRPVGRARAFALIGCPAAHEPPHLLLAHTGRVPPDVRTRSRELPAAIADLIMRSMSKKPEARPSAREVAVELASHSGVRTEGPVDALASALIGRTSEDGLRVSETEATLLHVPFPR